jgi:hypothetical protein
MHNMVVAALRWWSICDMSVFYFLFLFLFVGVTPLVQQFSVGEPYLEETRAEFRMWIWSLEHTLMALVELAI